MAGVVGEKITVVLEESRPAEYSKHLYAAAGCSEGKHYVTTLMDRLANYGIYGVCVCEIRSIIL